jgi:hypothetical protein
VAPAHRAKSRAPIAKRARKPKATDTKSPAAPLKAARTSRNKDRAEPTETAAEAGNAGAVNNRDDGGELRS